MKPWDVRGSEQILPAFVFLGSFITMSVLIVMQMPYLIASGPTGDWQDLQGMEVLGNTTYWFWNPNEGYTMNETYVIDRYDNYWDDAEANHRVLFWKDSSTELRRLMVNLIRDNAYFGFQRSAGAGLYTDYIMVAQKQPAFFGILEMNAYKAISFERIAASYRTGVNCSVVGFDIGKYNYTMIVQINSTDWEDSLYRNDFVIRIAKPIYGEDAQMAKQSMWTILGQILTARVPHVNWIVNWMIAIPIWTCAGFIVFTVITRAIHGG